MNVAVQLKDFYDFNPSGGLEPGDVWVDLPTYGLLPQEYCTGMVITPACDLSNRKVETITYLPIVTMREYLWSPGFRQTIRRAVVGQLKALNMESLLDWPEVDVAPQPESVRSALADVVQLSANKRLGVKERATASRAHAGLSFLLKAGATPDAGPIKEVSDLLGPKDWTDTISRIVNNSYRTDVHFLPRDRQNMAWSAIPCHSVILLRYGITAPINVFDAAQDVTIGEWATYIESVSSVMPAASAFLCRRPMKRISIRPLFVAEIITRYISIFARIGTPDFSDDSVGRIVREVTAAE